MQIDTTLYIETGTVVHGILCSRYNLDMYSIYHIHVLKCCKCTISFPVTSRTNNITSPEGNSAT